MKRIAALVGFVAVVGCRSTVENALGSPIGNYTLVSVDGSPLPFNSGTAFIVRGTVNLKSSGDYTLTQADSAGSATVTNASTSGTWSLTDNALALLPGNGSIELGIVAIDTIRLTHSSHQNLYVRR